MFYITIATRLKDGYKGLPACSGDYASLFKDLSRMVKKYSKLTNQPMGEVGPGHYRNEFIDIVIQKAQGPSYPDGVMPWNPSQWTKKALT